MSISTSSFEDDLLFGCGWAAGFCSMMPKPALLNSLHQTQIAKTFSIANELIGSGSMAYSLIHTSQQLANRLIEVRGCRDILKTSGNVAALGLQIIAGFAHSIGVVSLISSCLWLNDRDDSSTTYRILQGGGLICASKILSATLSSARRALS